VRVFERDLGTLVAPPGPPVRRIEEIAPRSITTSPGGKTIVDFGQNASGWLRITVEGPAGATITMRHAEILLDGELCTEPLRGAKATDTYTLRGGGPETWEPRFTFHGFRYAEISGWPGEISPDAVRFVVVHSDMERTGWFECSDPMVNRLHENAVWSMKSNFLDVPTDCPQRDERLGWTGDLTMFSPTGCFLHDASGFLANWLADLAADQLDDGVVPMVIPDIFNRPGRPNSGMGLARSPLTVWSDAAVIVPWVVYQRYGDAGVLQAQYDSMRAWVAAVEHAAGPGRLWDRGFQFADWLDPMAPPDSPQLAMTDPHLIATAYFCRISEILSESAAILGREEDRSRYRQLADEVRAAFKREYMTPSGRTASDTQTALSIAILFGMHDTEEQRMHAGQRLAYLVRRNNHRIATGFVGTALVSDALCATGEEETAFRMLVEQSCPSWLYPITQGATTIWERWDSLKPDGSINSSRMTSFNHYALGAVGDWLHRSVGGLAPLEPGYRRIEIRPRAGGGITWAKASHRTPYGMASSSWRIEDGVLQLEAVVPPNTTARVVPPDGSPPIEAGSGTHAWTFRAESAVRPPAGSARPLLT
jgi:alpha-L-rhamnosidase